MKATELKNNRIAQLLNLGNCKKAIRRCPKDETVILIPHYSINVQSEYDKIETPDRLIAQGCDMSDQLQWDFNQLQQYFNTSLLVTDYDDLVADPHGLFSL